MHIQKDTDDGARNYDINEESYSSDEDLDKLAQDYINHIEEPPDQAGDQVRLDFPSHLSSLSSLLLHSTSQCDITLVTPSLSLQAHKALLLPLLPSLLPLLCSSCSPHDPLVLLLPHTSSTSLAWALESLYLQGDSTLLARELGLQVDTIEGIQTGEEDPLDVMDEFGQEHIVKRRS